MWRCVLAAVLVYGCGHPALEGYRPEWLERPLQGFYQEVQKAAVHGRFALASFDQERISGYIRIFTDRFQSEVSKDVQSTKARLPSGRSEPAKSAD
jgi:hypothetical protein